MPTNEAKGKIDTRPVTAETKIIVQCNLKPYQLMFLSH